MTPVRVRLSRAKGFRLPENTVVVARPSKLGNPFVVGRDGTAEHCVYLYRRLLGGWACLTSKATLEEQDAAVRHLRTALPELRGKNLACWCRLDQICHADTLLELANAPGGGTK